MKHAALLVLAFCAVSPALAQQPGHARGASAGWLRGTASP